MCISCYALFQAPWEIEGNEPEHSWPDKGQIEFKDYSVRYRPGLELVLKDLSFNIKSGENVSLMPIYLLVCRENIFFLLKRG